MNTYVDIVLNITGQLSHSATKWLLSEESLAPPTVKAKFAKEILVASKNTDDAYHQFITKSLLYYILKEYNDKALALGVLEKSILLRIFQDLQLQASENKVIASGLILLAKNCLDVALHDKTLLNRLQVQKFVIDSRIIDNADSYLSELFEHALLEKEPQILGPALFGRRKAYMLGKSLAEQKNVKPTYTEHAQALVDCPDIITQAISTITEHVSENEMCLV